MSSTPDEVMAMAKQVLTEDRHEQFLKSLDEAHRQAQTLLDVVATPYTQAGQEILVGSCPVCRNIAALSAEGRHQCRACHRWLRYVRKS